MGMKIEDSNQFLEAAIQNQKHNQNARQRISEPAECVPHRFKESHEDCRKFVEQIKTLPARVAAMQPRCANGRDAAAVPLTQDEMTQQEEDEEQSIWSRGGGASPQERDAALRGSLAAVLASEGIERQQRTT